MQLQVEIQDFRRNYDQASAALEPNPTVEFLKWLEIGAVVSPQLQPLLDRDQLEASAAQLAETYAGDQAIPRPEYWGGYLLKPNRVEFWQGRLNRLHDRFLYTRNEEA